MTSNVLITPGTGVAVAAVDIGAATAATVTMTSASPCVVTDTGHTFADGQPIVLTTTGALLTGLTAGATVYVKSPVTNTYNLAATPGGTAINTSGTQSGTHTRTAQAFAQVVRIDNANPNGQGAMAASAPVALASDQKYQTGMSPRAFSATFTTLTRPANVTPYSAGDSISNNATAGSVTALSATVSDTNDDPVTITEILVSSNDTGLAGKKLRAYLFNSDPTANSGVGAGDNAAYSQKVAGYVGSFMGYMETGFSDGCVGRLVPTYNEANLSQAGAFVIAKPVSGAKTFYIQYQAVEAFTSSANSTTIIGTAKGFQGRAA